MPVSDEARQRLVIIAELLEANAIGEGDIRWEDGQFLRELAAHKVEGEGALRAIEQERRIEDMKAPDRLRSLEDRLRAEVERLREALSLEWGDDFDAAVAAAPRRLEALLEESSDASE